MKHIFHYKYARLARVTILPMLLLLGSCKKLIEIPSNPSDKVSTPRVYSDSLNVLGAMVGIYAGFGTGGFDGSINTAYTSIYTGLASDELVPNPLYPEFEQFSTNNILQNNSTINGMWSTGYAGIYQCNAFLQGIAGSTGISNSFKQQVMAEALLSRSLYYFNLVNVFGAVPIITGTDYATNAVQRRMPEDSVYALIQRDLISATEMLTINYPSTGRVRPNINAARAFLARVYLYKGQWQQAAELSNQVIQQSATYQLQEPSKVFLHDSKEAIWQLPTLSTFTATSDASNLIPYASDVIPTFYFSSYLANAFENGDLRKQSWAGVNIISTGSTATEYFYPAKYKNTNTSGTPVEDYMIFRLSEQYLIRSEAVAQQNLLDSARAGINKVRARAGLPATTALTRAEVLAAIEKERFTELFAEGGHRWFDLKRTGRINAVLGAKKPGWTATDALFPIPLSELQSNRFLTPNPGY